MKRTKYLLIAVLFLTVTWGGLLLFKKIDSQIISKDNNLSNIKLITISWIEDNDKEEITIINDIDKINMLVDIFSGKTHKNNPTNLYYEFNMYDKNKNLIESISYQPLNEISVNRDTSLNVEKEEALINILKEYKLPFEKIIIELKNTKSILLNDSSGNSKTITNNNNITEIINVISESKIWDNSYTLESNEYDLIFLNQKGKKIIEIEFNPQLIIKFQGYRYILYNYDYKCMLQLVNV